MSFHYMLQQLARGSPSRTSSTFQHAVQLDIPESSRLCRLLNSYSPAQHHRMTFCGKRNGTHQESSKADDAGITILPRLGAGIDLKLCNCLLHRQPGSCASIIWREDLHQHSAFLMQVSAPQPHVSHQRRLRTVQ